jgi:DeoR family fructose operon transcriptional repressor
VTSTGNLATEERLQWLRELLEQESRVRIALVAPRLGVSEMTVRRDLQELEAMGLARRVRGGAVAVGPTPLADRHRSQARAKARIAAKLTRLLPATGAIGMDASSTVMRLVSSMDSSRDLTVITNGPETFQMLQGKSGIAPLLTGGQLDLQTESLTGPLACRSAGQFLLTRLFASAEAVGAEQGASELSLAEAEVKRALGAVSGEVVLAVDASKLGGRSVAMSFEWEEVSLLVTELDPGDVRLDPYRDRVAIL